MSSMDSRHESSQIWCKKDEDKDYRRSRILLRLFLRLLLIVLALLLELAALTLRFSRYAVIPTEEDEWMMDDSLRLSIEYEVERPISLLWGVGIHDTETVHHAMDMCIDSDVWHIIEY